MDGTTMPGEPAATCAPGRDDVACSGNRSSAFLKNASPASGMSEVSMSFSAIASISAARFFEICIEEFPFIPGRFSRADNPYRLAAIGMDDADYRNPIDQPITALAHLIGRAFIGERKDRALEDRGGFLEADPMLGKIDRVFIVVPLEFRHSGARFKGCSPLSQRERGRGEGFGASGKRQT